jgi:hypothetical protein
MRQLEERRSRGEEVIFELDRPRESIGFRPAKIRIRFRSNGREIESKEDIWDDDLNEVLLDAKVRSANFGSEKERFSLGIRTALRRVEKRFGDGFFNAVLVRWVVESDFRDHPEVAKVAEALTRFPENQAHESSYYVECRERIEAAIRGRGIELVDKLGYGIPEAWDILAGALARYLDERFSVTNRRRLGLL